MFTNVHGFLVFDRPGWDIVTGYIERCSDEHDCICNKRNSAWAPSAGRCLLLLMYETLDMSTKHKTFHAGERIHLLPWSILPPKRVVLHLRYKNKRSYAAKVKRSYNYPGKYKCLGCERHHLHLSTPWGFVECPYRSQTHSRHQYCKGKII